MANDNAKGSLGEALSPVNEILRTGVEKAFNEAMEGVFLDFLEECADGSASSRNGYYDRGLLTVVGEITVRIPRDCLGLFKERVIRRYRRRVDDLDAEICRLYSQGMTASEISGFLSSGPGVEASEKRVLTIVKGIYGEAEKFNSRPIPECPVVFLDGT